MLPTVLAVLVAMLVLLDEQSAGMHSILVLLALVHLRRISLVEKGKGELISDHSRRTRIWHATLQTRLLPDEGKRYRSTGYYCWEFNPHAKQCLTLIGVLVVAGLDWTGGPALVVRGAMWALQRADSLSPPPNIEDDDQLLQSSYHC